MTEKPLAERGLILTVAMVQMLGMVGLVFLPMALAGEPTPPPVPPPPSVQGTELILLSKFQPWMIMRLVLGVLVALMGSLKMIYWYIAQVRTTEFYRHILLDAVTEYQFQKLVDGSRIRL